MARKSIRRIKMGWFDRWFLGSIKFGRIDNAAWGYIGMDFKGRSINEWVIYDDPIMSAEREYKEM